MRFFDFAERYIWICDFWIFRFGYGYEMISIYSYILAISTYISNIRILDMAIPLARQDAGNKDRHKKMTVPGKRYVS